MSFWCWDEGETEGWFSPALVSASSTICSLSCVSMFVYRLDTSTVTNMLSLGTLLILFSHLMKSVVPFMCDRNAATNGLKNTSTYADNFCERASTIATVVFQLVFALYIARLRICCFIKQFFWFFLFSFWFFKLFFIIHLFFFYAVFVLSSLLLCARSMFYLINQVCLLSRVQFAA